MAQKLHLICSSEDLPEGGKGVRFVVETEAGERPAFVIRYAGVPSAFVNSCAHMGVELDWMPTEFFDDSGLYLVCATHGALFLPGSGACIAGPCKGKSLRALSVEERDGAVFLVEGKG